MFSGVQPGDFPRGLGGQAGVPISTKSANIDWATRPGVRLIVADCQGSRFSTTKSFASHSCQLMSGIRSLQRSDCSGVLKLGSVQCSRCLANRYQWSTPKRDKYLSQTVAKGRVRVPTQANHNGGRCWIGV